MARVKQKHTTPEIAVRRALHKAGLRFRLHDKCLPGSPDIVLPSRRTAVFVHGCFWHRHEGCKACSSPKTREDFWVGKFEANVSRDRRQMEAIEAMGWTCLVIWECEIKQGKFEALIDTLKKTTPVRPHLR